MKKLNSEPVKTVLTISTGFLLVYVITKMNWAITVSLIIGLIGIFSTYLSKQIDFLWMQLTKLLSFIVPNILLSVIFFLFLFPIALISKIFGKKDPLKLKNNSSSVFVICNKHFKKESFEQPW